VIVSSKRAKNTSHAPALALLEWGSVPASERGVGRGIPGPALVGARGDTRGRAQHVATKTPEATFRFTI